MRPLRSLLFVPGHRGTWAEKAEVFSPSASEVEFYSAMIAAFETAVEGGAAAVVYEGMHVDYAHIKTAREILERSRQFAHDAS